jgi:hypothetical protein
MTKFVSSSDRQRAPRTSPKGGEGGGLVANYRLDHKNPVNHFLHVGVGWPMIAVSILLLPFRPVWSVILFIAAYAIMFFGHFAFERNTPTIFKDPKTPFVIAWAVICDLWTRLRRLATPRDAC